MLEIKDLLERFKRVEDPKSVRLGIISVLNNALKAELLTENDIEYKGHVVWITANPAIKHKILTSKALCLDMLKKALPGHTIVDLK